MSGGGENQSEGHAVPLNRKTNRFTGMPARTGENQKLSTWYFTKVYIRYTARPRVGQQIEIRSLPDVYACMGFRLATRFLLIFPSGDKRRGPASTSARERHRRARGPLCSDRCRPPVPFHLLNGRSDSPWDCISSSVARFGLK